MKTRTIITAVLVAAMAAPVVATSDLFTDVPADHPQEAAIRWVKDHGLFEGYADRSFKPDRELSEEELQKVVNRLFGQYDNWTRADTAEFLYYGAQGVAYRTTTTIPTPTTAVPTSTTTTTMTGTPVTAEDWDRFSNPYWQEPKPEMPDIEVKVVDGWWTLTVRNPTGNSYGWRLGGGYHVLRDPRREATEDNTIYIGSTDRIDATSWQTRVDCNVFHQQAHIAVPQFEPDNPNLTGWWTRQINCGPGYAPADPLPETLNDPPCPVSPPPTLRFTDRRYPQVKVELRGHWVVIQVITGNPEFVKAKHPAFSNCQVDTGYIYAARFDFPNEPRECWNSIPADLCGAEVQMERTLDQLGIFEGRFECHPGRVGRQVAIRFVSYEMGRHGRIEQYGWPTYTEPIPCPETSLSSTAGSG